MSYTVRLLFFLFIIPLSLPAQHALVFQSDFGLKDGAVSAMKGVAFSVSPELRMFDVTHEIPPYNIWEAAYRLEQVAAYWPSGTVFVSVVDPGVGSSRKSVVLKTKTGHYFVTPDNGTLTLVAETLGIEAVRQIDELVNRLKNTTESYTFHGRDVYAYTGARLAAGVITFEKVGALLQPAVVKLPYQSPVVEGNNIKGNIVVLDVQFGNVWTNIDKMHLEKLSIRPGDRVSISIYHEKEQVYQGEVLFGKTFSSVPVGTPVGYLNSLMKFSVGINQGNFSAKHNISSGGGWTLIVEK